MSTISGSAPMQAPQAWSGASAKMPPPQKMASLFDKIDTAASGSITKNQLNKHYNHQKHQSTLPLQAQIRFGQNSILRVQVAFLSKTSPLR